MDSYNTHEKTIKKTVATEANQSKSKYMGIDAHSEFKLISFPMLGFANEVYRICVPHHFDEWTKHTIHTPKSDGHPLCYTVSLKWHD